MTQNLMTQQELVYCNKLNHILQVIQDNYPITEDELTKNKLDILEIHLNQFKNFSKYVEENVNYFSDEFINYFNICLDFYHEIIDSTKIK